VFVSCVGEGGRVFVSCVGEGGRVVVSCVGEGRQVCVVWVGENLCRGVGRSSGAGVNRFPLLLAACASGVGSGYCIRT
jgi:hypothetical protein